MTHSQPVINPVQKNHVTIAGDPAARSTLLFLHGFGTDQTAWRQIVPAFEKHHRIILMDNMGAGQSDKTFFSNTHYLNLQAYAQDLLDVCASLQLENMVFVGHSVAGMIGVLAAIQAPQYFSKLILIGASPRYMNDSNYHGGFAKENIDAIYANVMSSYASWATGFAAQTMGNPDRPELARYFAASIQGQDVNHALSALCAIFQSDHRADLQKLKTPTLLVQTKEDIAVPLCVAEYMNQHIEASQLLVINATGHLPHISAPASVIQAIQDFLDA
ncbi:MAG: alpha/beta hydrolase [Proteobacteria bacterium]|nr:alpha/beta hydrolase [Pseudomonadota bacterium]